MGITRLLLKGWIVLCIFAAAHAAARAVASGTTGLSIFRDSGAPAILFCAMGLLFILGYGVSSGHLLSRFRLAFTMPGFNEIVLCLFLVLSFSAQIESVHFRGSIPAALDAAIQFAIPGQRTLQEHLARCNLDGNRAIAGAAAWLLAFVFLGSALSRLRITAGLVRLERKRRIEPLGHAGIAFVLGLTTVAGIQLLFVGSIEQVLSCDALSGITGDVLIGAGPLALAYLAAAAVVNLFATGLDS